MIVGLHGKVIRQTPSALWIQTAQGIVYEVFVSLKILTQKIDTIMLYTTQIVRDDGIFLYGFLNIDEKIFFDKVIRISGIGAKVALAILSTYTPHEFLAKLHDTKAIQKVPGLGPKNARRICVELAGFYIANTAPAHLDDARLALESLGFKPDKIQQVFNQLSDTNLSTQEIIKESLKKM